MKKSLIGCTLVLVLMVGVSIANSTPANFSGTWVLDKNKSDGLDRQLQNVESYTMIVTQDDNQLTVENKIVGGARPDREQKGASGEPPAPEDRGMGRGRRQGGFGGQGGGRGGRGGMGMGMGSATYKLDGSETKIESSNGRPGSATLKAQWKDNGKALELTNTRSFNMQGNDMSRTIRDRWELADGGKTLKVKRSVDGSQMAQESTLVFSRQ
jgi:hypothetical protein